MGTRPYEQRKDPQGDSRFNRLARFETQENTSALFQSRHMSIGLLPFWLVQTNEHESREFYQVFWPVS
jgi:hypothetical protein